MPGFFFAPVKHVPKTCFFAIFRSNLGVLFLPGPDYVVRSGVANGVAQMSSTPLSAGDYIAAKCSKCREQTNHTIVAMIEEAPVKVKCNTCGSEHKYRQPAAPKKPGAPRKTATRRTKADPQALERQQWQDLQESFDAQSATAYSMDASYKPKSLIAHPTFGLGQVQEISGARKMNVLFADGIKVLRCG